MDGCSRAGGPSAVPRGRSHVVGSTDATAVVEAAEPPQSVPTTVATMIQSRGLNIHDRHTRVGAVSIEISCPRDIEASR